jgi:SAM-dependent methyltransferase
MQARKMCMLYDHNSLERRRRRVYRRYRKAAKFCSGRILDIGCNDTNPFLKGTYIVGLDKRPLTEKHENYDHIRQGDANDLATLFGPNSFDSITMLEMMEHTDFHIRLLKACHKVLAPGGVIVISCPSPFYYRTVIGNLLLAGSPAKSKEHVSIYMPRILNMLMDEIGFDLVKVTASTECCYVPLLSYSYLYVYRKRK